MFFWYHQIDQKTNEIFVKIHALASKKRSNQKNKSTLYHTNLIILFWLSYTTFLIWPHFRGKGRNPYKNFIVFLVDLVTPKGHFEINWSLVEPRRESSISILRSWKKSAMLFWQFFFLIYVSVSRQNFSFTTNKNDRRW